MPDYVRENIKYLQILWTNTRLKKNGLFNEILTQKFEFWIFHSFVQEM